jgi:hypothetical protein
MPDASGTRSLACESKKAHEQVTTGTPKHFGIPCAMVLTAAPYSPRGAGLDSPRRAPLIIGALDPSVGGPGPHGLAVRFRIARPAMRLASIAPLWVRDAGRQSHISGKRKQNIFAGGAGQAKSG